MLFLLFPSPSWLLIVFPLVKLTLGSPVNASPVPELSLVKRDFILTCHGDLPPGLPDLGVNPATIRSRVTSYPPAQQLTKLCEAAGCACGMSDQVTCWPFGSPLYFYAQQCKVEWCYCFNNQENMMPIEDTALHPNVANNYQAPNNAVVAPPTHHRHSIKQQPPGAPCAAWNDCAGDNYVCKVSNPPAGQTKSQPGTCTWLANAISSAVSSALDTQCQRGRCLSEANGTITTNASSSAPPPPPPPLTDASGPFPCARNCTYVSQACCSTADGNVFEDKVKKVSEISAPSGSFCNSMTGTFQDVIE